VSKRPGIAALGLVGALVLVVAGLALASGPTEEPVRAGPANEAQPAQARARGKDILVWSQSPAAKPNRWDVFLRRGTGPAIRLNTLGRGYNGDLAPPWVVYQQAVGRSSDLRLYRLDTRRRIALPRGVNTKHWEWRPRISGPWLLFGRQSVTSARQTLILFNRRTHARRILATVTRTKDLLIPGQIAGNWVVWYACTPVCDAFVYGIAGKTKRRLAKPDGGGTPIHVWAPAVTRAGVVYAGQGRQGCGKSVQLVRYGGPGDPPTGTPLVSFPSGIDINSTYAQARANGSVDVVYTRVGCGTPATFDIYRITDPPPP
jgi:hypothetical protein